MHVFALIMVSKNFYAFLFIEIKLLMSISKNQCMRMKQKRRGIYLRFVKQRSKEVEKKMAKRRGEEKENDSINA
jgi:hypothetical protein